MDKPFLQEPGDALKTRGRAIGQLAVAIDKGYDGWSHMRADLDVDALRAEPGFKELFPSN